jgi:hypothetical protein
MKYKHARHRILLSNGKIRTSSSKNIALIHDNHWNIIKENPNWFPIKWIQRNGQIRYFKLHLNQYLSIDEKEYTEEMKKSVFKKHITNILNED